SFLHFDGKAWSKVPAPAGITTAIYSLWGSGANDVWAATSDTVLHFDGSAWSVQKTGLIGLGNEIGQLWGTGPSDVWAQLIPFKLSDRRLAHGDGQSWTLLPSLGFTTLSALTHIGGSGATDLWMVGAAGEVVHGDGVQFQELHTSVTATNINSSTD